MSLSNIFTSLTNKTFARFPRLCVIATGSSSAAGDLTGVSSQLHRGGAHTPH